MLTLYANNTAYPLKCDDYYIREVDGGRDELIIPAFSIWDELYPFIVEEASIQDRDQMHYLVKAIDAGPDTAKIRCEIDLDEWRATLNPTYTNGSASCLSTIQGVCPANWTVRDQSGVTIRRTIEGAYTPLDVAEACKDTYGITLRWDNNNRIVTIINPANYQPLGAFITRDLNLKEVNYKGSSTNFITRLYAYGADGLSFASINNGLPYVSNNTYSSRIICGYWTDNRYTDAASLLEDAKAKLDELAVPTRSYDCSVYDLANTNPDMYGFEDFSLFAVVKLIDQARGTSINHQVVERWNYPYYPEQNKVILSTSPAKIQSQITQITQQVQNPNSSFNQQQANAIANATNWITNGKGYVVAVKNNDGNWSEILIMDTPDIATATKVWRWNSGGLGYSSNGYNGPYTTAITQDGSIVADFITTGVLNADLIKAGSLESVNGVVSLSLDTGKLVFTLGSGSTMQLTTNGITFFDGNDNHIGSMYRGIGNSTASNVQQYILHYPNGVTPGETEGETVIYWDSSDSQNPQKVFLSDKIYIKDKILINNMLALWPYANGVTLDNLSRIYLVTPGGNSGGNVTWKSVNLSNGSTAYALCLE